MSTLMHSVHRSRILEEIRHHLAAGEPCRVVSTSLVEAGVDVDFPVAYRALSGIDSVIQCAGRCNRNALRDADESVVHVFESDGSYRVPRETESRMSVARMVAPWLRPGVQTQTLFDLGSPDVVEAYFRELLNGRNCDVGEVYRQLTEYECVPMKLKHSGERHVVISIPFASAAEGFRLIDDASYEVVIPDEAIKKDVAALEKGEVSRGMIRRMSRYSVSVYEGDLKRLCDGGLVRAIDDGTYILLDETRYRDDVGLDVNAEGGQGICW